MTIPTNPPRVPQESVIDILLRVAGQDAMKAQYSSSPIVSEAEKHNISFIQYMTYKYSRSARQPPQLTRPEHLRHAHSSTLNPLKHWTANYDNLLEQLSPALKELILTEREKPIAQRNVNLVAFNNLLVFAAKEEFRTTRADALWGTENVVNHTAANRVFGTYAFNQLVKFGTELLDNARETLAAMGQNNPDFQALKEALADFELLFAELKQTEESTYETEESTYE